MMETLRALHFRVLLDRPRWILAGVSLVTLLSLFGFARFGIDVSSRPFFPANDPSTEVLEWFQQAFPARENILLAVSFPDTVFSHEALGHLRRLSDDLSGLPEVGSVWSLLNVDTLAEHLVASGDAGGLERYLLQNPRYREVLVSADGRSALLLVSAPGATGHPQKVGGLVRDIRRVMRDRGRGDCAYHLSGLPVIQVDFSELILNDQRLFGLLAVCLLSLFMFRLFRTPWGVAVPMLCGGLSLCWTLGLFFGTGHRINLVSSVLSLVIMVISVANSIHLINYFLHRFRRSGDKPAALKEALRYALPPCGLATLTTVLGFLSLAAGRVPAVVDFVLFASLGIVISFLLTGTLVPVLLLRWVSLASARKVPLERGLVARFLRGAVRTTRDHGRPVLAVSFASLLLLVWGAARIHTTMDVMSSFPADSPSRAAAEFLQEKFIGAHVLELLISGPGEDLFTLENMERIQALDDFLNRQPEVNRTLSALLFARPYLENLARAPRELRGLMDLSRSFRSGLAAMQSSRRELLQVFLAPDGNTFRVSVFLNTADSWAVNRLAARIQEEGARILGPGLRLRLTGELLLFSQISSRLVDHLILSLAQAFVLIFLAIGLLLRSVKMLVISLVPNVLPLACFFGIMGWAGIDLTVPTAMLACIVLGLSVDDTVHFLHNYRARRREGFTPREAVAGSLTTVGRAMIFTSLILTVGFWLGMFSPFDLIAQFGFLAGVAVLVALWGDLILLPVVLLLAERKADA